MNNKHFVRKAFRVFVINSVLSSLGVVAGTLADAVILGNAFGGAGLSVLAVAMPVYMLYNLFGFAFGIGGSLKVAESIGAEDRAKANASFTQAVLLSIAAGALIALLGALFLPEIIRLAGGSGLDGAQSYMRPVVLAAPVFILAPVLSLMIRSDADPHLSTLGIAASFAVNISLDLVFIFGLKLGMFGAALAMVLGQLSAVMVYLTHFFKKHNHLRLCRAALDLKGAFRLFRGGLGMASSYVYQSVTLVVINNMLSVRAGEAGLAAYNILFNVSLFAWAVSDGISLALSPLVGTFVGEKDTAGIYGTMGLALKTALALGAACALLLLLLARPIVLMFGVRDDPQLVVTAVRLFALSVAHGCLSGVMSSFFQATGRHGLAGGMYMMRGFALPLLFSGLLIPVCGVAGAAAAAAAAESAAALLLLLAAAWIRKKKGCRNLLLLNEPVIEKRFLYETTLSADLSQLQRSVGEIEDFCQRLRIDKKSAYYINLTIEELVTNIIRFGFNDGKPHYISIKAARFDGDIYIRLRDDATSYNPFEERFKPDAGMDYLGVSIVRAKAKSFAYHRTLVFNNLLIIL